jgi:23S rRNA (guanine2445-N2)-methyltransferase / 23S rRNA (guanine2069-N7)-methyltransferase
MTVWFVTVPRTLERLLAQEIRNCGGKNLIEHQAGVLFSGTLENAYSVILWSRLASRVLLQLNGFNAEKPGDIYHGVKGICWSRHLNPDASFVVHCAAKSTFFRNTEYVKKIVKDAIVDQFRELTGQRPSVSRTDPDIGVHLFINQNDVRLSLDLTKGSLHRRGYRVQHGEAPLRENIAAAILIRAGWPEQFKNYPGLVDPMCGAGTIVIEAALMAANIAPGILPGSGGLNGWKGHDQRIWSDMVHNAENLRRIGLKQPMHILGYDKDSEMINIARKNAARAQIEHSVAFECADFQDVRPPKSCQSGLIAVNPPYGRRLSSHKNPVDIYQNLGRSWEQNFSNWKAVVLTSEKVYARAVGLRASKLNSIFNGNIQCVVVQFDVNAQNKWIKYDPGIGYQFGLEPRIKYSSSQSDALMNRLKKNHRALHSWLKRNRISCYRLYDADLPEFSAAVDVYQDKWAIVQEYVAPAKIDPVKANDRLHTILDVVAEHLNLDIEHIFLKRRRKISDNQQYERIDDSNKFEEVVESGLRFLVNFSDYLDTGIYLDHRPLRSTIREITKEKKFLNLFSYTSTATVYALAGGASFARSVDTSNTYLAWSEANLKRNKCNPDRYSLVRSDCLEWLDVDTERYDVIMCDAPTWSVGKDRRPFDIQKDHVTLVKKAMKKLKPSGSLFFSTHFRKFKIDYDQLKQFAIEDITARSIPKDFARNKRIHQCWEVKHAG